MASTVSGDTITCHFPHLSTLAVLMDIHNYTRDEVLEAVSATTSSITLLALFLTILVFFAVGSIQKERTVLGKHLCCCLFVGHVLVLTVMDKKFFYLSDVSIKSVSGNHRFLENCRK